MKFKDKKIDYTGSFFTMHQFKLWSEKTKCTFCSKRACWLPIDDSYPKIYYCDKHYPFGVTEDHMED